jgi:hypothetical protein
LNIHFVTADHKVKNINSALKDANEDDYVFFCDDSVVDVISPALLDMLGYLSLDGVCAVGCKFIDNNNNIFSVGLSVSTSGKLIYNYRGSPSSEHGYGAVASVPRNVSLIYPSFWGAQMSAIKEKGFLEGAENYFQASMNFFTELIKLNRRIVCVPYMCLMIDTIKIENRNTMETFQQQWLHVGLTDKYYNTNLTDRFEDFGLEI